MALCMRGSGQATSPTARVSVLCRLLLCIVCTLCAHMLVVAPCMQQRKFNQLAAASRRQTPAAATSTVGAHHTMKHTKTDIITPPGTCRFASGDRYTGAWAAGVRAGQGRCAFGGGDKYAGAWADDAPNGVGTMVFANGDRCAPGGVGTQALRCSAAAGLLAQCCLCTRRPVLHAAPGSPSLFIATPKTPRYHGEWQSGKRHGLGLMAFADGTTFRGRWQSGAWLQSAADPARCRLRGRGLARAVAGADAEFVIQVGFLFLM